MAVLQDLIQQIDDPKLRERILTEVNKLNKQKKFGLVFEEHLPECTPLYDTEIKRGSTVALKTGKIDDIYLVKSIDGDNAVCEHKVDHTESTFTLDELVCVAEFGQPIYPYLKPLDSVCNAPDSNLWHVLIEADNYHALQLLEYLYAGRVDCIYIDPPYNTGARDWKYNNNYVDNNDQYRHSKWLSFMEKRLTLAKKLLNPSDSVLIITIDEKEYLHLGCLLEELFPEARIQMISTMINPANVARAGEFGRSGEYIFFVMLGSSGPQRVKLNREWVSSKGRTHTGNIRWDLLKRSGTNAERRHSPGGFYPIYINKSNGKIEEVGDPLPAGVSQAPPIGDLYILLPIRNNGTEGNWQWSKETFLKRKEQGRVKIGGNSKKGFTVYILKDGEYSKITSGEFSVSGRGINDELIVDTNNDDNVIATPGDIWKISTHDSTQYGSRLLGKLFNEKRFTFPKSLYAVKDCIYFFTAHKKDALIVDFFAGSGTTMHAVNLLNAEDGGNRRCIMVTNNEVSESEAKALLKQGFKAGDAKWEELGIAHHVTWPRTICTIKGVDVNNNPLQGEYIGTDIKMSEGFNANAAFFKLGFLDKNAVALGKQFRELLPVLWMKSNCIGPCPTLDSESLPAMLILPKNKFAVLIDEAYYSEFNEKMMENPDIETIFIITDSESAYREMIANYEGKNCYQLYRDYLDNFRIIVGM